MDRQDDRSDQRRCDFMLLNCQALTAGKRDLIEAEYLRGEDEIGFLCVTETWWRGDGKVDFAGYRLVSSFCRSEYKSGGGVAVWGAEHLDVEPVDLSQHCVERHFEVCGVRWSAGVSEVIMIVCYRADRHCSVDILCDRLSRVLDEVYCRPTISVVVMGDFNMDPERDKKDFKALSDLLLAYGLTDTVGSPTRGDKILDHVFLGSGTTLVEENCFSDHRSLFCNMDPDLKRSDIQGQGMKCSRGFSAEAVDSFLCDLSGEKWEQVYGRCSVDEAYNCFHEILTFHYERSFPLRRRAVRSSRNEWVNGDVRVSSRNLRDLFTLQKVYPDLQNLYKQAKHRHSLLVRNTKKTYYQNYICGSADMSRRAWRVINALSGKSRTGARQIVVRNSGGETISDPQEVCEYFNDFFTDAPYKVVSQIPAARNQVRPGKCVSESFYLSHITEHELVNIITTRLKSKRSAGFDGFPSFLIKRSAESLIEPLVYLVNLSFDSGHFPSKLKIGKIIPVFKKGDKHAPDNYRPVTLTSVFSKIFEYCFLYKLDSFLNTHKVLGLNQFGFRPGKSTADAILNFLNYILQCLDGGECPVGVLCDLSRAFDCVNHDVLLGKLADYGVRGVPLEWVSSYLRDRPQYVSVSNSIDKCSMQEVNSSLKYINIGVPQGSVMAPILFNLYIEDMVRALDPACMSTLYADDTSFALTDISDRELENKVNLNLDRLLNWYGVNSLYLNPTKTNYIRFHTYQKQCNSLNLSINNIQLERVSSAKFLGIVIDENLSWKEHCCTVVSKLNSCCYLFRGLRDVLTTEQIVTLYHAQVGSMLRYGVIFWGASTMIEDVLVGQKGVVRCLLGLGRRESCRNVFKTLGILTVVALYILELCVSIYKRKHQFVQNRDVHNFNTRQKDRFHIGHSRLNVCKNSPNSRGIQIFNSLPSYVRDSNSLNSFKGRLKKLLLERTVYSVGEFCDMVRGGGR